MPPRAYVLIFVFWALLTIITPTLIFWSASAKPNLGSLGEAPKEIRSRRMMSSAEDVQMRNRTRRATQALALSLPLPAPASAPAPPPMTGIDTVR